MNFIASLVANPVKVAVGVLLTMMFGLVALGRMPMQLTPEVQTPTITVETRWPGASPQEIEREIVVEQEEQLKSVENVTKLTSESNDSSARISLEFRVGTEMDRAVVDVIGRLEQVPQYPRDADKPVISTANSSDRPIAWFILGSRLPTPEELDDLEAKNPELAEGLADVRKAHNPGLAMLRLRLLRGRLRCRPSPDAPAGVERLRTQAVRRRRDRSPARTGLGSVAGERTGRAGRGVAGDRRSAALGGPTADAAGRATGASGTQRGRLRRRFLGRQAPLRRPHAGAVSHLPSRSPTSRSP